MTGFLIPRKSCKGATNAYPSLVHHPRGTPQRAREVLRLIGDGQSNAEVARARVIALSTVKTPTNRIFGKLGVTSRTQAIARARELHLL